MPLHHTITEMDKQFKNNFVPIVPGFSVMKDWAKVLEGTTANYNTIQQYLHTRDQAIIEAVKGELGKMVGVDEACPACNGAGFTAEHDDNDGSEEHMIYGQCTSCPVHVQCEVCEGTGKSLGGINKERSRLRSLIKNYKLTNEK